ncbi:MAG: hypothetical protein JJU46_14895 [Balneolaceae bacterium]|nr:hypothetical protein [Balneolaceae bacterium]MCH8549356.1 hypothetical protein [Balneolaceae bacterium]
MKNAEKIAGKWVVDVDGKVNELPTKYNHLFDSLEAITRTKNHDLAIRELMNSGYSKAEAEMSLMECYKENRKTKLMAFIVFLAKALFWAFLIVVALAAFGDAGVLMYGLMILALIGVAKNAFFMLIVPFGSVKNCESPLDIFNINTMIKSP